MNYTKYWAPCTWTLFHTLVEKSINNNLYTIQFIKRIIKTICYNLPCPECTEHAREHIKSDYAFNNISTLNALKLWLFNFHNKLNREKNTPEFKLKQLDKYNNYKLSEVIYLWSKYYKIYNVELHSNIKKKAVQTTRLNVLNLLNDNKTLFIMY